MSLLSLQSALLASALIAQCFALDVRETGSNTTTATVPSETTSTSLAKVIAQPSVSGFEDDTSTSLEVGKVTQSIDIESIIASHLNSMGTPTLAAPHSEVPATGLSPGAATTQAMAKESVRNTAPANVLAPPANVLAPTAIITNSGQTLVPVPRSQIVIGSQTLTTGAIATWVEDGATTTIHLDEKGRPVLVLDHKTSTVTHITPAPTVIAGQTLSQGGLPITVGSGFSVTTLSINNAGRTVAVVDGIASTLVAPSSQVVSFGSGVTATVQAQGYQYVVAGSTLNLGHPVTISGTLLSLTTNAAGITLLVAGESTTTLASPVQIAGGVSTTVKDGTTQYIVGSQTLAPGHPVTIDGVAMAITTSKSNTVLVIGEQTTTVAGPDTTFAAERPGTVTGGAAAATGTKKGNAKQVKARNMVTAAGVALGIVALPLI